ncbi:MAG: T9SS type A sorting domain-containing protein, partial [Ignavibacteria bacterium]
NGINWSLIQLASRMSSVKFIDANTGWLCGVSGKIMFTANAGATWSDQVSGTISILNEVFMVNSTTGYIVGQNGTILKTTNGGITAVHQTGTNIPEKYSLSQNYPNPFNPTTQIKFDIPKSSFINLAIYDAVGKEISVLVDENLQAGSYSVDWNASSYPSGVYFYRITAGDASTSLSTGYIQTKKMVLVK